MKKPLFYALVFCTLLIPKILRADEVFWVQLDMDFSYQDGDRFCSAIIPGTVYFVALVDNDNKILHADFRTLLPFNHRGDIGLYGTKQGLFTSDETSQVKVERDALGEFWLKSLPLSRRLLMALYSYSDWVVPLTCRLPEKLATLNPENTVINFTQKDATSYFSPMQTFEGYKDDRSPYSFKNAYVIKLAFTQTLLMYP